MNQYKVFLLFVLLGPLGYFGLIAADDPVPYANITPEQAMTMIQQSESLVMVLDVRTPAEFAQGFIKGAISLDIASADFSDRLGKLDKKRAYVVYCRSGRRSAHAMDIMKQMGFERVYNLAGGMIRWQAEKRPIEEPIQVSR